MEPESAALGTQRRTKRKLARRKNFCAKFSRCTRNTQMAGTDRKRLTTRLMSKRDFPILSNRRGGGCLQILDALMALRVAPMF
jgi:hypothetical protein